MEEYLMQAFITLAIAGAMILEDWARGKREQSYRKNRH